MFSLNTTIRFALSAVLTCGLSHGQTKPSEVQKPSTDVSAKPAWQTNTESTTYQILRAPNSPQGVAMPTSQVGSRSVYIVVPDTDVSNQSQRESALLSAPETVTDPSKAVAHTNYLVLSGPGIRPQAAGATPPGETPDSIRTIYGIAQNGGSKAIAIVDAFDYPTAEADLSAFSTQFHLKQCTSADACLKIVYQGGNKPATNCDWAGETALDLQWAHAMAPSARLILVEASTDSMSDMFSAVDLAMQELAAVGGGELSLSWGSREFSGELSLDSHLKKPGVLVFASSGDMGGVPLYPSVSPYAIAVGGTTIVRKNGAFDSETGWNGTGGGPSEFEPKPQFQVGVENSGSGSNRSTPDLAAVADPYTGAAVFNSSQCQGQQGWLVVGGTSLAAPLVAGIVNATGHFIPSSQEELSVIYRNRVDGLRVRDIIVGTAGRNRAARGYDLVTGVGSVLGTQFDVEHSPVH